MTNTEYEADFFNTYCDFPEWLTEALASDDADVIDSLHLLSTALLTNSEHVERISAAEQRVQAELS